MRIIGFLFVYLFSLADLGAQVKDRYLELTHDTLSAEMVGTNFLRTTFSSAPQAFFMNKDCMDDCKAWEIEQLDDIYRFKAIEGHHLFHYSTDRLSAKMMEAPADRELYDLLSNLFRRALLLAEDVDGYSLGLDGYTCYFASTDTCGKVSVALKWAPEAGSLCRELTDLGDSVYSRIARNETDWTLTKQVAAALLEKLEKEPVDTVRNPVYRGIWQLGLQQKNPVELSEEPQFPGFADLEKYFYDKMEYPVDMLKANRGGYAVCQFTIDTMGMAKDAFTLDSSEPACEKEVKRLINAMSHWLPAYDKAGKRVECMYAVYVSFRPQHHYTRQKIREAWDKQKEQLFVDYESMPEFPGGSAACLEFISKHLQYPSSYIGSNKNVRVTCTFTINTYGELEDIEVVRGSNIPAFDEEALRVLRLMPRWKPAVGYYQQPRFMKCRYTVPVIFTDPGK